MAQKKQPSFQLIKMAQDLGLKTKDEPIAAILKHCENRIETIINEMGECDSLIDMLNWVANKVGTTFRFIYTEDDLAKIKKEFLSEGEKAFANIDAELSEDVYGITYRRQNSKSWEPPFVSIIDCRNEKAVRCYFTKWHEIAHLLTLTQQMRLVFRRTHSSISGQDPEERLMDVIAGKFGFYAPIFHKFIKNEISFEEIERLRGQLCPEASQLASLINFVRYWNSSCIYVRAELRLKKSEEEQSIQGCFSFVEQPEPVLRAIRVSPNERARAENFVLFENMRVPKGSVIYRVYTEDTDYDEAEEDLSWWSNQFSRKVKVKARLVGEAVEALIIPLK